MLFLLILAVACSAAVAAEDPEPQPVDEVDWAVGAAYRNATIPFATDERSVSTFIPFVYYDGDPFYFRGLEAGLKLWRPGSKWTISAMGRMRFFDIPEELQNNIQGDTFLWGVQGRYNPFGPWHLDLEVLSDFRGHEVANLRAGAVWEGGRWTARAYGQAQYKTSSFNTYYYGLEREDVDAGVELGLGGSFIYNLASNFFLFARAEAAFLDKPVRDASFVNRDATAQAFLGLGFSNDPTRTTPSVQKAQRYWRLSHGWVTPSSLADIFHFEAERDPDNNQMTSLFYGHPLSDTLLGLPLNVYLHGGAGYHWPVVQEGVLELVMAIKLYYTVPWPIRWKLGAAEGWSWVTEIPYVERNELEAKGYEPSQLLNYLDFSLDLNLGDLFGWIGAEETLDRTWLGYGIHHRSAIFESAQQFGRIKGGSNVQTVYLQYDF